jgi:hypothetical protein
MRGYGRYPKYRDSARNMTTQGMAMKMYSTDLGKIFGYATELSR